MNVILFDDPVIRTNLLPFTFTRPVASIRTGILTIAEKWEKHLGLTVSFSTSSYLQAKFPLVITHDNLWINGAFCPDSGLVSRIKQLQSGEGLTYGNQVLALRTAEDEVPEVIHGKMTAWLEPVTVLDQVWKIFQDNGDQIQRDLQLITAGRKSRPIDDPHSIVYAAENIFVEENVYIRAATFNAETGPIYLGKGSIVQEGAIIRGPFALGEGSHVNMGAKIRGNVSVGPYSKVGGEISASVIFGYSNKAHDGFMGCSVIGEWCNLGAGTNISNLKNNYENVKLWNYAKKGFVDSGVVFCGLMMGDHSKSAINTMFNTGTVVGVAAHVFGAGFPRNFVPSFAWGGPAGYTTIQLRKTLEAFTRVMERRSVSLSEQDSAILEAIFNQEAPYRVWEKK